MGEEAQYHIWLDGWGREDLPLKMTSPCDCFGHEASAEGGGLALVITMRPSQLGAQQHRLLAQSARGTREVEINLECVVSSAVVLEPGRLVVQGPTFDASARWTAVSGFHVQLLAAASSDPCIAVRLADQSDPRIDVALSKEVTVFPPSGFTVYLDFLVDGRAVRVVLPGVVRR